MADFAELKAERDAIKHAVDVLENSGLMEDSSADARIMERLRGAAERVDNELEEIAAIAEADKRRRATHAVKAMLEMALDNDDTAIADALREALELIG